MRWEDSSISIEDLRQQVRDLSDMGKNVKDDRYFHTPLKRRIKDITADVNEINKTKEITCPKN